MEPVVDLRFYKELANKRQEVLKVWRAGNEKLADLDKKRESTEDSMDLLEDDMFFCLENSPVDLLEYRALKAEMSLMVDNLKQIEAEAKATEASLEKLEEDSKKLKKMMLDMKRILQERGKVLPFRKPDEGK